MSQTENKASKAGCKKAMCAVLRRPDCAPWTIKNNAEDLQQPPAGLSQARDGFYIRSRPRGERGPAAALDRLASLWAPAASPPCSGSGFHVQRDFHWGQPRYNP